MTVIIVEKGSDVYSAKYNAANVSTKDKNKSEKHVTKETLYDGVKLIVCYAVP
ncbi:hypothetical protein GCM10020331_082550 [Ectobacillus funiculus]